MAFGLCKQPDWGYLISFGFGIIGAIAAIAWSKGAFED